MYCEQHNVIKSQIWLLFSVCNLVPVCHSQGTCLFHIHRMVAERLLVPFRVLIFVLFIIISSLYDVRTALLMTPTTIENHFHWTEILRIFVPGN